MIKNEDIDKTYEKLKKEAEAAGYPFRSPALWAGFFTVSLSSLTVPCTLFRAGAPGRPVSSRRRPCNP